MHYLWWAFFLVLFALIAIGETRRIILSRRFKHIPGVQEVPIFGSFYTLSSNRIQGKTDLFTGYSKRLIKKCKHYSRLSYNIYWSLFCANHETLLWFFFDISDT